MRVVMMGVSQLVGPEILSTTLKKGEGLIHKGTCFSSVGEANAVLLTENESQVSLVDG